MSASVLKPGAPDSTLWVSPPTKPLYCAVSGGLAAPYGRFLLSAVTASTAGVMFAVAVAVAEASA